MGLGHYSATRAKRSLAHFLLGKLASAALSAIFLALTVRYMTIADFGFYVVVLAALDLFYLTTGFGLSTLAQRYVTEFRTRASTSSLLAFLGRIFFQRLVLSLVFALLLLIAHQWVAPLIGHELDGALLYWVALLLVVSASSFFLDEVLGALLMQGLFQGLAVGRIFLKCMAVIVLVLGNKGVAIQSLLIIEFVVTLATLCLGQLALSFYLRGSRSEEHAVDNYDNQIMWATARKFYFIQLIGQVYGPNIARMLVARFLGLAHTAVFGFAQSVADMLRNFMPAHLLAGWLRPLMISRYLLRRNLNDLADVANLVLKLNLLGIVPVAVFFVLRGDAFGSWVSGGQYPQAGNLLALLTVMVGLQTAHLLFAMITITLEQPNANIVATLLAALSLPLSIFLIRAYGVEGAAWGLLASETLWLLTASLLLARQKFYLTWDFRGALRLLFAGIGAGLVLWVSGFAKAQLSDLSISAAVTALSFLALSVLVKPLREQERAMVSEIIPARFILW